MKYLIYVFFLFLFSCDPKDKNTTMEEERKVGKTVSFEKLNSIQIDYLGNPTVHDLDPESETILFVEDREFSDEIHVADFDGNIMASFSKTGDVPDSYGALMATLRINGDSSFIAYSYNGFLTYDFSGQLQSRIKLKEFQVPNFYTMAMGFGMEKLKGKYLYIDQGSRLLDYSSINVYQEMRLLNWLDPETGERESFIYFPENSIFRSGKYFFRDSWAPAFTLADDLIYVAFGIEPVIYLYETAFPYSLVSSIPLDLPDYQDYKGSDSYLISLSLRTTSGRIENIKKIYGFIVVAYFPGYNASDIKESFTNKTPEEAMVFRERMREKYTSRIAILDSLGNLINDFVPGRLDPKSMLLRNDQLWMFETPDLETEQDYFRLFRVGLKIEGSE
ncbi:hypothetical protein [Negadavirga shengliensis]|uniref:6-bladed beta-propeller protein n=1 Tax=Negadavirga shengliensis TaxID=1389218 RepID=A0ABV9T735_9BACT